ncbi:uncharacterized protein FRV6_02379 [Fusarium oxysporum]|uniref:Uncharacterized protein n=1 Tax=Fusarium oxysporum TaxID=5507 RepID=A0A2H3SNX8_FUSOX|nr:uncharacterized protein FRV6_02379 [Fusarium oxysporum]
MSSFRYNPPLDDSTGIDPLHRWPASNRKNRRQDMFVKLRTQNAKGRDAHRPVSPDMFKSNDYMCFDLEHPRQAVSVRVSVQENIIKTGSARPTRGPKL